MTTQPPATEVSTPKFDTDVLVIGAGPTGLALAGFLAKQGVRVRAVDKNADRSVYSKAIGVHAGTLEQLEAVFGAPVTAEMREAGFLALRAWVHFGARIRRSIDLGRIPSKKYPFILMLAQSETERILETEARRLGATIDRAQELVSFASSESDVCAEIRHADGRTESVRARYLVGCDGAHSAVRRGLGVEFKGGIYDADFSLGDVTVRWPWEYGTARAFLSDRGVLAAFPMKGERRYRLILIPHGKAAANASPEISAAEFRKLADHLCPGPIEIVDTFWLTRFRVHHRLAKTFRSGRAFIAGDAAHIHSPVGGQGMNTGIHDAFNLGDKLARVLRHAAPEAILDRYEAERLPIARTVVRATDFLSRLVLRRETWLTRFLRGVLLPLVLRSRWLREKLVEAASQLAIAHRELARRRSTV